MLLQLLLLFQGKVFLSYQKRCWFFLATALVATLCLSAGQSHSLSFSLSLSLGLFLIVTLSLCRSFLFHFCCCSFLLISPVGLYQAGSLACLPRLFAYLFLPFSLQKGESGRIFSSVKVCALVSAACRSVCQFVYLCALSTFFFIYFPFWAVFAFCCVCLFVSRIAIFSYLLEFQKCFSCFCFSLVITAFCFSTFSFWTWIVVFVCGFATNHFSYQWVVYFRSHFLTILYFFWNEERDVHLSPIDFHYH